MQALQNPPAEALAAAQASAAADKGLRRLVKLIGEQSSLAMDPLAETYYLQDLLTDRAIAWIGSVHTTLALVATLPEPAADKAGRATSLADMAGLLAAQVEAVSDNLDALQRSTSKELPKGAREALQATAAFAGQVRALASTSITPEALAPVQAAGL